MLMSKISVRTMQVVSSPGRTSSHSCFSYSSPNMNTSTGSLQPVYRSMRIETTSVGRYFPPAVVTIPVVCQITWESSEGRFSVLPSVPFVKPSGHFAVSKAPTKFRCASCIVITSVLEMLMRSGRVMFPEVFRLLRTVSYPTTGALSIRSGGSHPGGFAMRRAFSLAQSSPWLLIISSGRGAGGVEYWDSMEYEDPELVNETRSHVARRMNMRRPDLWVILNIIENDRYWYVFHHHAVRWGLWVVLGS